MTIFVTIKVVYTGDDNFWALATNYGRNQLVLASRSRAALSKSSHKSKNKIQFQKGSVFTIDCNTSVL